MRGVVVFAADGAVFLEDAIEIWCGEAYFGAVRVGEGLFYRFPVTINSLGLMEHAGIDVHSYI